jgi:hypothetical protein
LLPVSFCSPPVTHMLASDSRRHPLARPSCVVFRLDPPRSGRIGHDKLIVEGLRTPTVAALATDNSDDRSRLATRIFLAK